MKKMRFYIEIPPIKIGQLSEIDDFQLMHEIEEDDFTGTITINLDPKSIDWWCPEEHVELPDSFSKLIITLEEDKEIDTSNTQFLETAYFIVTDVLENFFNYIQIELGQHWVDIGFIQLWGLYPFLSKTTPKWVNKHKEIDVGFPLGAGICSLPTRRKYPEYSIGLDIKQISEIKSYFKGKKFNLSQHLLANAKRQFSHNDYKMASILAITAIEGPLKAFMKKQCELKGITRKHNSVSYDLNHLLSVLERNELDEWLEEWIKLSGVWSVYNINEDKIIAWAIELNKKRNDAIHEGITPDFEILDRGIFAIEAIYALTQHANKKR